MYTYTTVIRNEPLGVTRPLPSGIYDEPRAIRSLLAIAATILAAAKRNHPPIAMTLRAGEREIGTITVRPAEGLIEKSMWD